MTFIAIDHPAIACCDPQSLADWYCQHLEMTQLAADGKQPPAFVLGYAQGMGQAVIEIMPARQGGPRPDTFARFQPGLRHLAFRVSDFDAAYARLQSAGVRFIGEPGAALGGGRIISFYD